MEVVMGAARWPNYELGWGGLGGIDRDAAGAATPAQQALDAVILNMMPCELRIMRQAQITKS
jgi:hypothetical protein